MAPFNYWKRKRYYRNRWRPFRRRRPRKYFQRRFYRRRTTVRRKKFKPRYHKKLKKLKLQQWQPKKINKCRIRGVWSLFAAGYGRYSNDYEIYRESYTAERQPGGGGWSTFKLSLGNLYSENEKLLNWWTKSNKLLNLCRYIRCTLRFYRQESVDYVATYSTNYPFVITKFQFPSTHPQRLLLYNQKVVVPSYLTAPHLKKRYIKKKLYPPSEFYNKWFFQSDFSTFPLVMITASACSLNDYFISSRAESNNITLYTLNTSIFQHKNFKQLSFTTYGYQPKAAYYIYGTKNGSDKPKQKELIYLGNTTKRSPGEPNTLAQWQTSSYPYNKWGNPFWHDYLSGDSRLWVSTQQPNNIFTSSPDTEATKITEMSNPIFIQCRYNPWTDKGYGNKAYWVKITEEGAGWPDEPSSDLMIEGFPLWILLWGFEDWTNKLQKTQHLWDSYALVVVSKYIKCPEQIKYFVFVSQSFIDGVGPYGNDRDQVPDIYLNNWYPCWQYQKEAIEELLMCGPAVCKSKSNIHAHMGYTFHFKWGGNPTTMDNIYDPATQPTYTLPNKISQGLEIENPEKDPTKILYPFDIRRDFITQTAAKRLKKESTTETALFTDGVPNQEFSLPIQATQEEETSETSSSEEEEPPLQLQLNKLQQQQQRLLNRYRRLNKKLQSTK